MIQCNHLQIFIGTGKASWVHRYVKWQVTAVICLHRRKVKTVIGWCIFCRCHTRLGIQALQQIHQTIFHNAVPSVRRMIGIIEVLPLGNHTPLCSRCSELGADRFQHIHHGQFMPPSHGSQPLFQVPVICKDRKQENNGRFAGIIPDTMHQTFVAVSIGFIPQIIDGEFYHD